MHDSDWFDGLCPCNDYPCKRSVAAQQRIEKEDRFRGRMFKVYMKYHTEYPQGQFFDDIIKLFKDAE